VERVEEGAAVAVQADYLTVEDGVAHASERDRDLGGEGGKALEGVAVAGDETTLVALHVGEPEIRRASTRTASRGGRRDRGAAPEGAG